MIELKDRFCNPTCWEKINDKCIEIVYKKKERTDTYVSNLSKDGYLSDEFFMYQIEHVCDGCNLLETVLTRPEFFTFNVCSIRIIETFKFKSKNLPIVSYFLDVYEEWSDTTYNKAEQKCLSDNPKKYLRIRAVYKKGQNINHTNPTENIIQKYIVTSLQLKLNFYQKFLQN